MEERLCLGCGVPLEIGPRDRNPKRWCSQKCRVWKTRHPDEVRPISRACGTCGVDISHMQLSAQFCSKRCIEVVRGRCLAESLPERTCELPECGERYQPQQTNQRACCERHGKVLWNRESRADGRQKPEPWTEARKERWKKRQQAKKAASTGRPVVREAIGDRDGWICYLCEQPIDRSLVWPDPESATTDHVVPLSKGGEHDPDNVRITHARCNSAKGDRLPDQLLTR